MKIFIEYSHGLKTKIYTSDELDHKYRFKKYNNTSYKYYRNNGPSYLQYKNDELTGEIYYKNNKLHRLDGQAIINHVKNEIQYWINGKQYESEFEYWLAVGNYRKEKKIYESIYSIF